MQRSPFNGHNSFCAQKLFVAIIAILLVFLSACEVTVEPKEASKLVSSAEATVWESGASSEEDYSTETIAVASLTSGTEKLRLSKLTMPLKLTDFPGYQWVSGEFLLTASADVRLTITTSILVNGEVVFTSAKQEQLKANEEEKLNFDFQLTFGEDNPPEDVVLVFDFSSTLPFVDPEEESQDPVLEGTNEFIEFATWAATEYTLGSLTFLGIQNTAV